MLHNTRGIVFRTVKYSETSVIATIYTEKLGIQSYMINGVRTAKAKNKQTMLQPLTLLNLIVYHRENKNLQRIKEMQFSYLFTDIPFNILKSSILLFLNEVLNKSVKEESENPELFDFIYNSVLLLDRKEGDFANFHLYFMLELSKYLGFAPAENYTDDTPYFDLREGIFVTAQRTHPDFTDNIYTKLFYQLTTSQQNLKISNADRKVLLVRILTYFELHLENFKNIQSLRILEQVLQ